MATALARRGACLAFPADTLAWSQSGQISLPDNNRIVGAIFPTVFADKGYGCSVLRKRIVAPELGDFDTWMPFVRAGISDGDASLYDKMVTIGFARQISHRDDMFGLSLDWSQPSDRELNRQFTTEVNYRLQLAQNFQLTASLQLLVNPALNPDEDLIAIYGLGTQLTF